MKKLKFEWYVINENHNTREIKPYNIFNNYIVNDMTNELCIDYKRKKMSFEEFTENLRRIIMYQEWSRCEYEIVVSSLFDNEHKTDTKIDCYNQILPNIKIVAKYVLEEYYPKLKIKLGTDKKED